MQIDSGGAGSDPIGPYGTAAGWLGSGVIDTTSSGALALTTSSSTENIDMSSYPGLSLGAVAGGVNYQGTITLGNGENTYMLGGGAGVFTVDTTLSSADNIAINGDAALAAAIASTGTLTVNGNLDLAGHGMTIAGLAGDGTVQERQRRTTGSRDRRRR